MSADRARKLKQLINDLRPLEIEPLAAILNESDMASLRALDALGHFMRCTDTGRYFCPSLCTR